MRGQFELRTGDGAAATAAFKKALALAPGGRAHFGLAQAAYLTGDVATATKELGETITASPKNGAALILRAELAWSQGHDDAAANAALKDIATLLEGPARELDLDRATGAGVRASAARFSSRAAGAPKRARRSRTRSRSTRGTSQRSSGKGTSTTTRGATRRRSAATKRPSRSIADAIRAIVGHAKTHIRLERLADAKTELVDAVKRFPKSSLAMQWLAESEATLGNKKDAEKDFLAAIDLADPKDPDAIDAYAAYANFLSRQGRADEAQAKLKEALKKLPDTAALERTLGDVAEAQGLHDEAISRVQARAREGPAGRHVALPPRSGAPQSEPRGRGDQDVRPRLSGRQELPGPRARARAALRAVWERGRGSGPVQRGAREASGRSRPAPSRRRGATSPSGSRTTRSSSSRRCSSSARTARTRSITSAARSC